MYRDNIEALRARVDSLEAQVVAEVRHREAAEAQSRAAEAQLREAELAMKRGIEPPASMRFAWPVLTLTLLGVISTFYLGRSWSTQWHVTRRAQLENRRLRHDVATREALFLNCERARRANRPTTVVWPTQPGAKVLVPSNKAKTSEAQLQSKLRLPGNTLSNTMMLGPPPPNTPASRSQSSSHCGVGR